VVNCSEDGEGSIRAYAAGGGPRTGQPWWKRVDPRVRGGHVVRAPLFTAGAGRSARTRRHANGRISSSEGLRRSARTRWALLPALVVGEVVRSIRAYADCTFVDLRVMSSFRVDPRVRGRHPVPRASPDDAFHDAGHRGPRYPHQRLSRGLRAVRGKPGDLLLEPNREPRPVPRPGHRRHDHLAAAFHPQGVGFEEHPDRAQVQPAPPPPAPALVITPRPAPAAPTPALRRPRRSHRHDQRVIRTDRLHLDRLQHRTLDPSSAFTTLADSTPCSAPQFLIFDSQNVDLAGRTLKRSKNGPPKP